MKVFEAVSLIPLLHKMLGNVFPSFDVSSSQPTTMMIPDWKNHFPCGVCKCF